ncbi:SIR2 family protein [Corallococcus sp. AB011P]|uniref:SIR2 family protein n=1 Tax=Corallococcus sp. AB011P TaxID=2316735 RepID=UPI0013153078|nr:SIR2 family protein [Corallococcus sp. AB011P]
MGSEKLLPSLDALRSAVKAATRKKKIAFLVGSPLSMQETPDAPQVPGVTAMLQFIRKRVPSEHLEQFDAGLKVDRENTYQWAMKFIQDRDSRSVANEVIREAVLRARLHPDADQGLEDVQIDTDFSGWALPPATLHLGGLLAEHPGRFGPVMTTNFDPLLPASVKAAGGEVLRTVVDRDEPFSQAKLSASNFSHLVYLHGYWLEAETLHTSIELARERPRVAADITHVLTSHTLVVVGYGGWDDIFTQTLAAISADRHKQVDILWAFFDKETSVVQARNKHFLDRVRELTGRNQLRLYGGINCHELFARLREDFGTSGTATTQPPNKAPKQGKVEPQRPAPIATSAKAPEPTTSTPHSTTSAPTPTPSVPSIPVSPSVPKTDATASPPKSTSSRILPFAAAALFAGGMAAVWPSPSKGVSNDVIAIPPPRNLRPVQPQPPTTTAPAPVPASTLRSVRQQHQVVAASDAERGTRVSQLPRGRYAFVPMSAVPTYSADTTIYGPIQEGIELHRALADGSLYLVGYADAPTMAALGYPKPAPIVITPTPGGRRTQVASIPVSRMTTAEVRMDKGTRVLVLHLN